MILTLIQNIFARYGGNFNDSIAKRGISKICALHSGCSLVCKMMFNFGYTKRLNGSVDRSSWESKIAMGEVYSMKFQATMRFMRLRMRALEPVASGTSRRIILHPEVILILLLTPLQ